MCSKQIFKTEESIKNTQLFNVSSEWSDEVKDIENGLLKDRLYQFSYKYTTCVNDVANPDLDTSIIDEGVVSETR